MILGSLSLWESVTTGLQSYGIASLSISKEKEGCFSPGVFLKFDALSRVLLPLSLSFSHTFLCRYCRSICPLRGTDAAPSKDAQILDLGNGRNVTKRSCLCGFPIRGVLEHAAEYPFIGASRK